MAVYVSLLLVVHGCLEGYIGKDFLGQFQAEQERWLYYEFVVSVMNS